MAARYYEQNTSGMNFDRFLDRFDETTLVTMKRHYWTAKQLLRTKLGKKEDEHLKASDAELDSKLTLFHSVRDTSESLLACIEQYQGYLLDTTLVENELGKFLKVQGRKENRDESATIMIAVGRCLLLSSHQRAAIRQPIFRFYQELHVFAERAIADCTQTVDAVERARLEYRGSLLWMKKTSEELDPDTDQQLDKFREAQTAVRANKERLDKLKLDTLQKVDLLSASRSNLLSHLLGKYLELLITYYEKTSRAYQALASNLSHFQHYEFDIPVGLGKSTKTPKGKQRSQSDSDDKREKQNVEREGSCEAPARISEEPSNVIGNLLNLDDQSQDSLQKYFFGRDSPPPLNDNSLDDSMSNQYTGVASTANDEEEDPSELNNRVDSPLGLPQDDLTEEEDVSRLFKKMKIGPLAPSNALLDIGTAEVPRLAPPPVSSSFSSATLLPLSSGSDLLDDLFSTTQSSKPEGATGSCTTDGSSIMHLLNATKQPETNFPNPFQGEPSEWDLLLSQCDIQQQTNDLL
ncbi:unnamed protein product [Auanema sp. JU1783]|nr:unnamed protein product [Auanema sp. JU1783]